MLSHFSDMNPEHKAVKTIANVGEKPKGTTNLMENSIDFAHKVWCMYQ